MVKLIEVETDDGYTVTYHKVLEQDNEHVHVIELVPNTTKIVILFQI